MTNTSLNIAIVLLAAGASSRMGATKQLLPWGNGTLVGHAIRKAAASKAKRVVTVLGANAASIREVIQKEILKGAQKVRKGTQNGSRSSTRNSDSMAAHDKMRMVENPVWASGIGSSIARGTDILLKGNSIPDGILVMLADQPLIDTVYLDSLISAFPEKQSSIIATDYGRRAGVPAIFPAKFYEAMTALNDDVGAKRIIEASDDVIVLRPGKKTLDIDTKKDYERVVREDPSQG